VADLKSGHEVVASGEEDVPDWAGRCGAHGVSKRVSGGCWFGLVRVGFAVATATAVLPEILGTLPTRPQRWWAGYGTSGSRMMGGWSERASPAR
jgi:hypothetical protein